MNDNPLNDLKGTALKAALKNRSVAVMGLGQSGLSAARCLAEFGAEIFLSESQPQSKFVSRLPSFLKSAEKEFGRHSRKLLKRDLIVVSPGIDWHVPVLVQARKMGIPVWTELELGYRCSQFKEIVSVTGTNGKTTTVSLIGDICKKEGRNVLVAGNIGKPLSDFAWRNGKYDTAVLEVSSYQLEGIRSFHSQVSVLLNLTSDHLHRHGTMNRYAQAKKRIFLNQTSKDCAVLNFEDPWCRKMSRGLRSKTIWFSAKRPINGIFLDRVRQNISVPNPVSARPMRFPVPPHLFGLHNVENSCAAIAAALRLKISPIAIRKSLLTFKGVEHRLEKAAEVRGVSYINDSKSTNVDSTLRALESFSQPVWLIMGGEDKGAPYLPLRTLVSRKVKGLFLIGEASGKIFSELKGSCDIFFSKTLTRAVQQANGRAQKGEAVLLSPGCASFDQFENFEDRGRRFKEIVMELKR